MAATSSRRTPPALLLLDLSGEDDGDRNDANDDEEDDDSSPSNESLLGELRTARRDMFGADVPSNDDLRAAARKAECDFLAAMREESESFRKMKDDVGSDGACEAFMERIREAYDAEIVDINDEDDNAAFGSPRDGITAQDDVDSWQ
jgi:hypothetical protein